MLLTSAFLLSLAAAPVPAEQPAKPEAEKKICKVAVSTGSRMARGKVCKTQAQWDEDRENNLEDARRRSNTTESTGR
jgi:hypothetical protein